MSSCGSIFLLAAVVRIVVTCVLVLGAYLKLRNAPDFEPLTRTLGISTNRSRAVVSLIPIIELALGTALFAGFMIEAALGATWILFTGFTVILLLAVRRGYDGNCGCFGEFDTRPIGKVHFAYNGLLLLATLFAWLQGSENNCATAPVWELPPVVLAIGVVVFAAVTAIYLLGIEIEHLSAERSAIRKFPRRRGATHD